MTYDIRSHLDDSRRQILMAWGTIATNSQFEEVNGSRLRPIEGEHGRRARDLDMRRHIDHQMYTTSGSSWDISTRYQDSKFLYGKLGTITLRYTEVEFLRCTATSGDAVTLCPKLHAQIYGDQRAVIVWLDKVLEWAAGVPIVTRRSAFGELVHPDASIPWLVNSQDGTPFVALYPEHLDQMGARWESVDMRQMVLF